MTCFSLLLWSYTVGLLMVIDAKILVVAICENAHNIPKLRKE